MNEEIKQIAAYETYALRHQVMWPNMPLEFVQLKDDAKGIHFGLFKNTKLIGVVSLFVTATGAQFRKLAIAGAEQGKGYGTRLVQHIIEHVNTDKNSTHLWCNARADKIKFYQKFGMVESGERFQKEGVAFCVMTLSFLK